MATYPNDATGSFTTATFTDMRDRKPDRGYNYDRAYDVVTFQTDAGSVSYTHLTLPTKA